MSSQTSENGGTGWRFGHAVVIVAGVMALCATLITLVSVWLQTKNYRKPLLQRYVVRILVMVPIFSAASWAGLTSLRVAFWIDPFRDVYEAFTIYTFFQLLINFIGGERSLLILMHGRRPVPHLWPLNHCLPKVDISDPHTFLEIKRGILQYTWVKPLLAIATVVMKATGTYKEGYLGLTSGYLWSGLIYNISIAWCLYALALFWVCMSDDLQPFRPMPKFLCIKGIIFASWWQGFFLSILVWLGAIPDDVPGYTPDNLAAAIQDALICFEMPAFALAHWYAFSWHDYADVTISAARMPIRYALRDAFGPVDLIQDTKDTLAGSNYEYREFDAYENVIAHEQSSSREARMREGMRYARGGKGKYWIPKPGHVHDTTRTPLLNKAGSRARTMSPGASHSILAQDYGTGEEVTEDSVLNPEDESLYDNARALEFGDWNYPVIVAHEASRADRLYSNPPVITQSTNRHVLQPTSENKKRRKSRIQAIQDDVDHKKHRGSSSSGEASSSKAGVVRKLLGRQDSSESSKSDRSQLVDLVVEDHEAEVVERARARKDGGPAWNEAETKHFVRTYPADHQAEEVREGYEPAKVKPAGPHAYDDEHNLDNPFVVGDNEDAPGGEAFGDDVDSDPAQRQWQHRDHTSHSKGPDGGNGQEGPQYGSLNEERDVWGSRDDGAR